LSKKINFEDSLKRLEEIASHLESGDLSLDDSLKYFEEGVRLSRFCEKKLTEVEQKLEILKSTEIDGELDDEDLEIDDINIEIDVDSEEIDIPEKKTPTQTKKKKAKDKDKNEESDLLF
jgi:exodeoxyribonuclease VII small subunit